MKQIFNILLFTLLSYFAVGQDDSLIIGEYTHVEQIGRHTEVISTGNNQSMLSKTRVDTSITRTLHLDSLHTAVLKIDTLIGLWSPNPIVWLRGNWSIDGDSLLLQFNYIAYESKIGSIPEIPLEYEVLDTTITEYYTVEYYREDWSGNLNKEVFCLVPIETEQTWLRYRKIN